VTAPATDPLAVATVALPYRDARSAAAGLRAELRHQLAGGPEPDWATFTVSAPVRCTAASGALWFSYTATVGNRRAPVAG
jgi:hypothetical protein